MQTTAKGFRITAECFRMSFDSSKVYVRNIFRSLGAVQYLIYLSIYVSIYYHKPHFKFPSMD